MNEVPTSCYDIQKYTLLTALLIVISRMGKKIVRTILENVVSKSIRVFRFNSLERCTVICMI